MAEKFDNGIRFKKITGAVKRPKDIRPVPAEKPKPVKIEEKPVEPIAPERSQEPPKGPPKVEILMPDKVKTGVFIFVPEMPDKVSNVYLNNSCLNARTDYLVKDKSICFSFNVRKNEKITVVGVL